MALTEFLILRTPQSGCLEERTAPIPSQLGISCTASLRDPPARCVSATAGFTPLRSIIEYIT